MTKTKNLARLQELIGFGEEIISDISAKEQSVINKEDCQSFLMIWFVPFIHKQVLAIKLLLENNVLYKEAVCIIGRTVFEASINLRYISLEKENAIRFIYTELNNKKSFPEKLLKIQREHQGWSFETKYTQSRGGFEEMIKQEQSRIEEFRKKFNCKGKVLPCLLDRMKEIDKYNAELTRNTSVEGQYYTIYEFYSLVAHAKALVMLVPEGSNPADLNLNDIDEHNLIMSIYQDYLISLVYVCDRFQIKKDVLKKFEKVINESNLELKEELKRKTNLLTISNNNGIR